MRAWIFGLVVFAWTLPAWAEYRNAPGKRFDLIGLTDELQAVAPSLTGCEDTNGVVTCHRQGSDFTQVERSAMDTVVSAHDPDARTRKRASAILKRTTLITRLCQGANLTGQDLSDCQQELR